MFHISVRNVSLYRIFFFRFVSLKSVIANNLSHAITATPDSSVIDEIILNFYPKIQHYTSLNRAILDGSDKASRVYSRWIMSYS